MTIARVILLATALAAALAAGCQLGPQNPPYIGCDPPCASGESCFRGYCVRGDPRAAADNGVIYVPAPDASVDASADGG